jgi:diphosphomevalonate decarboxylase
MKSKYKLKTGSISWQSPSNIALVKYWGKKGFQIPANPSLSITLSKSFTETKIDFKPGTGLINFYFEDKRNQAFALKIQKYFDAISEELPFVKLLDFEIRSRNTFPHSAGIASSASAMSALALCLCSLENEVLDRPENKSPEFYQRASDFARIGSGSASRSVFGDFASWGKSERIPGSSDKFASPLSFPVHPVFKTFQDTILIVSNGEKKVSSRAGHGLMNGNPFAASRYVQAGQNLGELISALQSGDQDAFVKIVENEALTLHGMMMASTPGYMLMEPNTITAIKKIQHFREQTGLKLCFTLDAGPNVHLLYASADKLQVMNFVNAELKSLCENNMIIEDEMGSGPKRMCLDE